MKTSLISMAARSLRVVSLVVVAALGTVALMRYAPGYFTDEREMDAARAESARASLDTQKNLEGSIFAMTKELARNWTRGNLGDSKQYGVPVTELIKPRILVTGRLLAFAIGYAWATALVLAVPLSLRKTHGGEMTITSITCSLLSIPVGAMATACMLSDTGGALTVLTVILVVRDFKLVYKLLRRTRQAPHLLHARAQGIPGHRIVRLHLLAPLTRELLAIAMISLITALGAIVPVEVIFDVPGLGQLAWTGAMNRDLPVLLGVTLLMASAVGVASTFAGSFKQMNEQAVAS